MNTATALDRSATAPKGPNWVLLVVLIVVGPFVWTVGPVLSFLVVVITVLAPFLAFITVPVAGLLGTMVALWTTLALREGRAAIVTAKARHGGI